MAADGPRTNRRNQLLSRRLPTPSRWGPPFTPPPMLWQVEQRSANSMAAGEGASAAAKAARPAVETMSATSAAGLTCRSTARPNCNRGTSLGGDRRARNRGTVARPVAVAAKAARFFRRERRMAWSAICSAGGPMRLDDLKRFVIDVPRYTSYPTAAEFSPAIDADAHVAHLRARRTAAGGPVSLYVHLPFCQELCHFCGCHALVARTDARVSRYLGALDAEAALVAGALGEARHVSELHFGGGSPSLLSADQFE